MSTAGIDVGQIVDLVKRSDRADAIELFENALAVAHSAGITQGLREAHKRADELLAQFTVARNPS